MALVLDDIFSVEGLVNQKLLLGILAVFVAHPRGTDLFEHVDVSGLAVPHFEHASEGTFTDLADLFEVC